MKPGRHHIPDVWRVAFAIAAVAIALSHIAPSSATSGSVSGGAYSASGSGMDGQINAVALPPGGDAGGSIATSGPLQITGASSSSCAGGGLEAVASCVSTINNLSISAGGVPILSATQVRSQSNSAATSNGATSDSAGSLVSGLCIASAPPLPCTPVGAAPGSLPIGFPGGPSGSITLLQEVARSAEGGIPGSGLTTRGMRLDFTIPGLGAYSTDLAVADSFVSGTDSSPADVLAEPPVPLPALPVPVPPLPELPLPALPVPPGPGLPAPPPGLLPALPAPPVPLPALPVPIPPLPIPGKAGPSGLPNAGNSGGGGPFTPSVPVVATIVTALASLGAAARTFARRL